jgi:mannose PTS system EIID component
MTLRPPSAVVRRLFLRSLLVQTLWNPRDLLGSGVAWILDETLPPDEGADPFNAHPYLAGAALGAFVAVRERGELDPAEFIRFRAALRTPLGAVGDALVWAGWLPFTVLAALLLLLAGGVGPLAVVAGFLVVYNLLHLWTRHWAVRTGLQQGVAVGSALARSAFPRLGDRLRQGVVFLVGGLAGTGTVLASGFLPVPAGPGGGPGLSPGPVTLGVMLAAALGLLVAGRTAVGRLAITMPLRVAFWVLGAGWLAAVAAW